MAAFHASEWIAASPEIIFAFISDVTNFPAVLPSVQHAEKLTEGSVGLGTRFRETRLMNGREATAEIEVTTYQPPHRYAATSTQHGITATYHYSFKAEEEGTRVDLQAEISADGLRKLMLPIVMQVMKKEDGDHLVYLKQAVEKGSA